MQRQSLDVPDIRRLKAGRLALIFATLLAAACLLPTLDTRSFWLDEVLSLNMARNWAAMRADSNMWLYHLLLRGWLVLGSDEWTVRLLPALFAIAAVPLTGLLAGALFGDKSVPYAALLMAMNPLLQQYGAEARAYSLLLFLVVLSSLCFVRILKRRGAIWWAGFVLASVAAIYAHFFAVLVLAAQAVALLLQPRGTVPWKGFILAGVATVLSLVPLAVLAPLNQANVGWIPRPTVEDLLQAFEGLAGSGTLLLLYLAAALAGLWAAWRRRHFSRLHAYVWIWLLLPVTIAFGYSLLVKPMFVLRYLIICLPALLLLAAAGLASLQPRALGAGALLVMLAAAIPVLAPAFKPSPGWRELTNHVVGSATSSDVALVYVGFHAAPFEYYLRQTDGPNLRVERLNTARGVKKRLGGARRVWLVLYYNEKHQPGSTAGARRILRQLGRRYPHSVEQSFGPYRLLRFDAARD